MALGILRFLFGIRRYSLDFAFRSGTNDFQTCKFLQEVTGYHNDGIGSLSIVKNEIWSGSWDRTMCVFALENKR